ncbi:RCC1 domain-containing protein [Niabella sp. 22666]|uniref:RCC1 domain-containing protein n=1 Tax=Niabella sp. 22666 TaxID=3453954 RepID=UPI003F873200
MKKIIFLLLIVVSIFSCKKDKPNKPDPPKPPAPEKRAYTIMGLGGFRYHYFIIRSDSTLWAWGENYMGQLATGNTTNLLTPTRIMDKVIAVSSGNLHTAILKSDGTLWSVGWNFRGQLGDNTLVDRLTPVQTASDVVSVQCVSNSTMFLKKDKTLWYVGENVAYLFAPGVISVNTPVKVFEGVKDFANCEGHFLALKEDGTAWGMGSNYQGQLGIKRTATSPTHHLSFVKLMDNVKGVYGGATYSYLLTNDNKVLGAGLPNSLSITLPPWENQETFIVLQENVSKLCNTAYGTHFIIKSDKSLWATGSNMGAPLIDSIASNNSLYDQWKKLDTDVTRIHNGGNSMYVKNDTALYMTGSQMHNLLGFPGNKVQNTFVRIPIPMKEQ